jgi:3-oxoacyl-[acyl-carrier-protein] synthase-3
MGVAPPWLIDRHAPRDRVSRVDAVGVGLPRSAGACGEGEDSLSLAVDAARDCLARSRHRAEDIEVLICSSVAHYPRHGLSYQVEPPLSLSVKEAIGARSALNLDLSHSSAGMLTGVFLLDDLVARGVVRCGLVVSGECLSPLAGRGTRGTRSAAARSHAVSAVADAGAAVLVEPAGDGRPGVVFAAFTGPARLDEALAAHGLLPGDIDWLLSDDALAPAARDDATGATAGPSGGPKHVVSCSERYGNSASATPFVALSHCLSEGCLRRGERAAIVAAAPGQLGVVVVAIDELEETHGRAH